MIKPLGDKRLRIFFSTLWPFYKQTPGGILCLSLRLGDYWMSVDEWEATAHAAYILRANCDEYGLIASNESYSLSHHQLFKRSCVHFGIDTIDFKLNDIQLSAGDMMGEISYRYYRLKPIPEALGFHLASEYTSNLEFTAFLNCFMAHQDYYKLNDDQNPVVQFFKIHTIVEPLHQKQSEASIYQYLSLNPSEESAVVKGIEAYLSAYYKFFLALNNGLFNE